MSELKKYQFHADDKESPHGYKNVPVFLSEDGTLSIEGGIYGNVHINDLFIYSWEIDGKIPAEKNKYSYFLQKSVTEFLNIIEFPHIKKVVVDKNAEHQFYSENGCLVDNYHKELAIITEECETLDLRNMENVRNIGEHAGDSWKYKGTLVIPETIEEIGKMAFCNSKISKLVFDGDPGGDFSLDINRYAFFMCENLETVDFGARKIKVYREAFTYSHIINLDIPENIEMKEEGFQELRWAKNINIHCKKIPSRSFLRTAGYGDGGCMINMEDVENVEVDSHYDNIFNYSKLDKVIISGEFYKKLCMSDSIKSWNDNINEIEVHWYIGKDGKIAGAKR